MPYEHILYEAKDHVATLTFNRPHRLNATMWPMRLEIADAVRQAEADDDVRVLIVTGAGRAFCAGLDIKAKAEGTNDTPPGLRMDPHPVATAFMAMEKPTIAAMNGVAVGAGFEMAMLCDFRFAAPGARMGDVHVQRNLVPDVGVPWTLPKIIGWSRACEIVLGGDLITSERALEMGMLNRVVPAEQLMDATNEYAAKLAANAPVAMRLCKRMMRRSYEVGIEETLHLGLMLDGYLMEMDDFKEALAAVAEKRQARFIGR